MGEGLARAAIVDNPAAVEKALKGEVPTITLNSVSLVSPDLVRGTSPDKSERDMLSTQREGLKAAEGLHKMTVTDPKDGQAKEISVRVKINPFNFGVNRVVEGREGKFNRFSILGKKTSGWSYSIDMNKSALKTMLGDIKDKNLGGDVAAKLKKLDGKAQPLRDIIADARKTMRSGDAAPKKVKEAKTLFNKASIALAETQKEINIITDLATQIKTMAKDQSYIVAGDDPYKMASRVVLLSNKLGHSTAFNCKSGKDRTGQLDAEIKQLAATADIEGRVPEPNQKPTEESRKAKIQFALNTGNLEMQAYNTGLPGYKTALGSLKVQMENEAWPIYRGGSDKVSS